MLVIKPDYFESQVLAYNIKQRYKTLYCVCRIMEGGSYVDMLLKVSIS